VHCRIQTTDSTQGTLSVKNCRLYTPQICIIDWYILLHCRINTVPNINTFLVHSPLLAFDISELYSFKKSKEHRSILCRRKGNKSSLYKNYKKNSRRSDQQPSSFTDFSMNLPRRHNENILKIMFLIFLWYGFLPVFSNQISWSESYNAFKIILM
jgi:hypothetical protein